MNSARQLRTLVTLGRVANLPLVWSNCLAGWWLGGGGTLWKLPFLFLGVSLLHTAGAFLNDAFDAESDRQRRTERPVAAGKIPVNLVWKTGFSLLGAGILTLLVCGVILAFAALLLAATILLYNFSHKFFTASPWLMGTCRFWVYVIAGASGAEGLNGWLIFSGVALALYATGVEFVEQSKPARASNSLWHLTLLAAPVVIAMLINSGSFQQDALCLSAVLLLWLVRSLRTILFSGETNARLVASNLLAGMVFVDWIAIGPAISHLTGALVFLALFGLAIGLKKIAPLT